MALNSELKSEQESHQSVTQGPRSSGPFWVPALYGTPDMHDRFVVKSFHHKNIYTLVKNLIDDLLQLHGLFGVPHPPGCITFALVAHLGHLERHPETWLSASSSSGLIFL